MTTPAQPEGELRERIAEAIYNTHAVCMHGSGSVPFTKLLGSVQLVWRDIADAALSVIEPEMARLRDESAHRWECQQTLERIVQKLREDLAAVTKERDGARVLLGEFTGAVMWGHPTWAFDGNPRSALGWLREDYELIRAFSAVNTKQEQELAATKAKLDTLLTLIQNLNASWIEDSYSQDVTDDMARLVIAAEKMASPPQAASGEALKMSDEQVALMKQRLAEADERSREMKRSSRVDPVRMLDVYGTTPNDKDASHE